MGDNNNKNLLSSYVDNITTTCVSLYVHIHTLSFVRFKIVYR